GAEPYVAGEKEERKYDLDTLIISKQPGSIPLENLTQGDNWLIFHLFSAAAVTSLLRDNDHFSDDLLSSLLNELIPGQGVFWSSVGGKPYPVSLRALSFEKMFSMRDHDYNQTAGHTYAQTLRNTFAGMRQIATTTRVPEAPGAGTLFPEEAETEEA